jgi:hypothetical protein
MEIYATAPEAETNLGLKVGDTAARVFDIYRSEYMEPESIHEENYTAFLKSKVQQLYPFDLILNQDH